MKLRNKILLILICLVALFIFSGNKTFATIDEDVVLNFTCDDVNYSVTYDRDTAYNYTFIAFFNPNGTFVFTTIKYGIDDILVVDFSCDRAIVVDSIDNLSTSTEEINCYVYHTLIYDGTTSFDLDNNNFQVTGHKTDLTQLTYNTGGKSPIIYSTADVYTATFDQNYLRPVGTAEVVFQVPEEAQAGMDFKTLMENTSIVATETMTQIILETIMKIVPILVGLVALSIGFLHLLGTLRKS